MDDFVDFSLGQPTDRRPLLGRMYVPPEASSGPRPLIINLHGGDKVGRDNLEQIDFGVDNVLAAAQAKGAFLYAPQSPAGIWRNQFDDLLVMLDRAISDFSIDPHRIYLTGISLGGQGVVEFLSAHGDRIAAGVSVAPASPSTFDAVNVLDDSLWTFVARDDQFGFAPNARAITNEIVTAAGRDALQFPSLSDRVETFEYFDPIVDYRYTEFGTGGHALYSAYQYDGLFDWVFSRSLEVPEPAASSLLLVAWISTAFRRR